MKFHKRTGDAINSLFDGNAYSEIKRKQTLKAWINILEVKNLRRTKMSAVFDSYDGQLENIVFRTHWIIIQICPQYHLLSVVSRVSRLHFYEIVCWCGWNP